MSYGLDLSLVRSALSSYIYIVYICIPHMVGSCQKYAPGAASCSSWLLFAVSVQLSTGALIIGAESWSFVLVVAELWGCVEP